MFGPKTKQNTGSAVTFTAGDSAIGIPFEFRAGHIYLQARVNDSEPITFNLDTGASSIIDLQRAQALKLKFQRSERGSGVGEQSVDAPIAEGVTLSVSGVRLTGQTLVAVPLRGLKPSDPFEGLLGYGFMRDLVVEIDFAKSVLNLHSPKTYRYRGNGIPIPLKTDGELVFARGSVKPVGHAPVVGWFEIDTGARTGLTLSTSFVKRHKLLPTAQQGRADVSHGVGGNSKGIRGKVESLSIGVARVLNLETMFSQATAGMLTGAASDGLIGLDFLRHFKVVFVYAQRLMILEPRQDSASKR